MKKLQPEKAEMGEPKTRRRSVAASGAEGEIDPRKETPNSSLRKLIKLYKKTNPEPNEALIYEAYEFAKKSHHGQRRSSGEEFIVHPLGVARIIVEMNLDTASVAAAILHDVVEDTDVDIDTIRDKFGSEIADIIDGLTKLSAIKTASHQKEQADNLRKMIIAMARDIRVILIKLADRLHNMQTLRFLAPEKQKKKAKETIEIYAPLAHRLGISQLKWQLEDLGFYFLEPQKYLQIQKMVSQRREEREAYLSTVSRQLKKELKQQGIKSEIHGRPKHYFSIYEKMVQRGKEFSEIYDLSGMRIVVEDLHDCYAALGVIHSLWTPVPGRFKDYIAMPKFNMYQSLHTTLIGPAGRPLEVQIRTKEMDMIAEYGIAAHWRYKSEDETAQMEERLSWLRGILEWQRDLKDPRDFMETLKIDLFQDEVFVFTPKGRVVSLPSGSTPIDFAYSIHTDVGHQCVGAKVNNRIVPLEYHLNHGDIVEVLTSKSSGPSRDWLQIVKTSKARNKVRHWFSKHSRQDNVQAGRDLVQQLIRKQHLSIEDIIRQGFLDEVASQSNLKTTEDLYASIGAGNTSAHQVVTKLIHAANRAKEVDIKDEEMITQLSTPAKRKSRTGSRMGVKVRGVDDVLVRLAKCCNPVPGDEIIGFVTRGRGISVHRQTCLNAIALMKSPERNIDVSWDVDTASAFPVEIEVTGLDRRGLLRDITMAVSDANVNILHASVGTNKDMLAIFRFVFEIGSVSHLKTILGNIKRVDSVIDAYRLTPQGSNATDGTGVK